MISTLLDYIDDYIINSNYYNCTRTERERENILSHRMHVNL